MESNPRFESQKNKRMHTGKVVMQRVSKYWNDMKKQGTHDIIKCYCKK